MSGPSPAIPEFATRFEAARPPIGRRIGVAVGAVLAALASAGLAWWLAGEDGGRMTATRDVSHAEVAAPQPRVIPAAPRADPLQVQRAYDEVRTVYAERGAQGLADFARECAETLRADPRILDYCLAFDMYGEALAPAEGEAAAWFQVGEARRLRLARESLPPGLPAPARIAEVAALMRQASQAQDAAGEARRPVASTARKAPAKARPASRCRFAPTPAERILCANPDLQATDRRMRQAFRRAVAAGADREILDGEQAAWRTARNAAGDRREMADLYARRLRELAQHAAERR